MLKLSHLRLESEIEGISTDGYNKSQPQFELRIGWTAIPSLSRSKARYELSPSNLWDQKPCDMQCYTHTHTSHNIGELQLILTSQHPDGIIEAQGSV